LAQGSNTPGTDQLIKGFLNGLEYVYNGSLSKDIKDALGIVDEVDVPEVQDYMPRERKVKPDGR
jgi:hypothetical protein